MRTEQTLTIETVDSPIGAVLLVSDGEAVRALEFAGYEARLEKLLAAHWGTVTLRPAAAPTRFRRAVEAYFAGDLSAVERIPVRTGGTDFQREVWAALRAIPPGSTATYSGLARNIGRPRAVRAVGAANAMNPAAIIQPCHRVVGADAKLTGYAGGLHRKEWLLRHEGAR